MIEPTRFASALAQERARERPRTLTAFAAALLAGAGGVLLPGVSGGFLAGAGLAGLGGALAVAGFNYLLPSAGVRAFAILRTGGKYAERYFGHAAALAASGRIRALVFIRIAAGDPRAALGLSGGEAAAGLIADVGALETALVGRSALFGAGGAVLAGLVFTTLAGGGAPAVLLLALLAQTMALRAVVDRAVHPARVKALDAAAGLKRAAQALARAAPELIAYDFAGRAGALLAGPEVELAAARAALARAEAALLALPLLTAAGAAVLIILVRPPTGGAALAMAVLGAIAALEGGAALTKEFERRGMEREALRRLDALPAPDPQIRQGLQNHALVAFEICIDGRRARLGPGDRLLIAGASGTGKTRLLETLLGFRAGPAEIRLDGRPLSDYDPREARSLFAFAAQDAPLLSGSIWENLTLGAPGLTRADAFAALDAAGLGERVRRAPEGLATLIGDHGERLSGGERKRLALARALLRPAPFLMLDEPTEGLDAETEALVTENLQERLRGTGQGLILVSHRLAPQALCGAILHL